jgi:O-antigen/teichoic acid export membrane protein
MLLWLTMNTIGRRADVLMVGAFLPPEDVGYYTAALRYADLIVFTQQAVNGMAAPMFASLHASGRRAEMQRVAALAACGTLSCALPLAIVMLLFGGHLLAWFGEPFRAGHVALVWLAGGQLVNGLAGSVGSLAAMTGHQREASLIVTTATAINLVLNAVLIPRFGIEGAGMATATSIAFTNVAMLTLVRTRLGVNPTVLGLLRRGTSSR